MIPITRRIAIGESELHFAFVRSAGPGGQNVNKVATAVQLRFNVLRSPHLSEDVKARLRKIAGKRITTQGVIVIEARRHRTQERNRQDAIARLIELIRRAAVPPKPRRATQPTATARAQRLTEKRARSEVKRGRRSPRAFDE